MIHFNLPKLTQQLEELKQQQNSADFWNDIANAQNVSKQVKNIEDKIDGYNRLCKHLNDIEELLEMGDDEEMLAETEAELNKIQAEIVQLHVANILSGKYDYCNAILTIHAVARGPAVQCW